MSETADHGRKTEPAAKRETALTWLVIAALMVGMIAWGMFLFRAIGDRPRTWQYRSAPFIPAESYASTQPAPAAATAPKQVELPPATVGKRAR